MNEENTKQFVIEAVRLAFEGEILDGPRMRDLAVEYGILTQTTYDPAKHGKAQHAQPGDDWYLFSEYLEG